jgi:hypothetical protein
VKRTDLEVGAHVLYARGNDWMKYQSEMVRAEVVHVSVRANRYGSHRPATVLEPIDAEYPKGKVAICELNDDGTPKWSGGSLSYVPLASLRGPWEEMRAQAKAYVEQKAADERADRLRLEELTARGMELRERLFAALGRTPRNAYERPYFDKYHDRFELRTEDVRALLDKLEAVATELSEVHREAHEPR